MLLKKYLFIFCCVGSYLQHVEFFVVVHGLLFGCDPQASEHVDSVVEACGLTCPVAVGF